MKKIKKEYKIPEKVNKTLRTTDKVRGVSSNIKDNENDNRSANEYASDNAIQSGNYLVNKSSNAVINKIKKQQVHYGQKENARSSHKKRLENTEVETNNVINSDSRNIKTRDTINSKDIKVKGKGNFKNRKTLSDTYKTVKTSENFAKRTVSTVNSNIQKARRSKEISKHIAKTTIKRIQKLGKALYSAAKMAAAALKTVVTSIAAGGWVAVVVILVIGLIVFLVASPWGIFFNDTDEETPTIAELVVQINNEYSREITKIITNAGEIDELIINGDTDNSSYTPYNWVDVLGVYAVKTSANPANEEYLDVLIMDEKRIRKLKEVFWDMNSISFVIEEEIIEDEFTSNPEPTPTFTPTPYSYYTPTFTLEPTPSPDPDVYRKLIITLNGLSYEQGAEEYKFNEYQVGLLNELMSVEYYSLFMEICGMNSFSGLTPEQAANLINNLPTGYLGSTIVEYALSRLGDPYDIGAMKMNKKTKNLFVVILMVLTLFLLAVLLVSKINEEQKELVNPISTIQELMSNQEKHVEITDVIEDYIFSTKEQTTPQQTTPTPNPMLSPNEENSAIATITIKTDRKTQTYDVMPDVDEKTLKKKIGHLPSSSWFGEAGLCVLMGHVQQNLPYLLDC